ncbi:MAG: hypothetical protein CME19_05860 [Gemmatimonadetes bacterium]|nr:hypothetical protein [Gemmatimonadota bacterium]
MTGDYPTSTGGVYQSDDGGETWTLKNCGLTSSASPAWKSSPVMILRLLSGLKEGQPRSRNFRANSSPEDCIGRQTWTRAVTAVDDSTNGYLHLEGRLDRVLTFGANLSALGKNGGFLTSKDGCTTWSSFADSLRSLLLTEFALSSDGQVVLGNARNTFYLLVFLDGALTWQQTEINQANGPGAPTR